MLSHMIQFFFSCHMLAFLLPLANSWLKFIEVYQRFGCSFLLLTQILSLYDVDKIAKLIKCCCTVVWQTAGIQCVRIINFVIMGMFGVQHFHEFSTDSLESLHIY